MYVCMSSKRQVYITRRMQHIRVDAFRQKTFSTRLSEIETTQTPVLEISPNLERMNATGEVRICENTVC